MPLSSLAARVNVARSNLRTVISNTIPHSSTTANLGKKDFTDAGKNWYKTSMLLEDIGDAANRMVSAYGSERAIILLDLYSKNAGALKGYYWRIKMLIQLHEAERGLDK